MKLANPRLVNIARALQPSDGASSFGEDAALLVLPTVQPVFLLSDPIIDARIAPVAALGAGQTFNFNSSVLVTSGQAATGVGAGNNSSMGTFSPGGWALSIIDDFSFTGTSNNLAQSILQLNTTGLGAANVVSRNGSITGRHVARQMRIDFVQNNTWSLAHIIPATVAGDVLLSSYSVFAQRVF